MNRRYTGILFLLVSILIATSLGGLFYYFQIKKNESYQNQLHFRELNDISTSLNSAYKQMISVAKEGSKYPVQINLNYLVTNTLGIYEFSFNELNSLNENKNKYVDLLKNDIKNADAKVKENKAALLSLENEMNTTFDTLNQEEDKIEELISSHLELLPEDDSDIVEEYCDENDENCTWLGGLIENIVDIDSFLERTMKSKAFDIEQFIIDFVQTANKAKLKHFNELDQTRQFYQGELVRLKALLSNNKPPRTFDCKKYSNASFISCDDINSIILRYKKQYERFQSTQEKHTKENGQPITNSLVTKNNNILKQLQGSFNAKINELILRMTKTEERVPLIKKALNNVVTLITDEEFTKKLVKLIKNITSASNTLEKRDRQLTLILDELEGAKQRLELLTEKQIKHKLKAEKTITKGDIQAKFNEKISDKEESLNTTLASNKTTDNNSNAFPLYRTRINTEAKVFFTCLKDAFKESSLRKTNDVCRNSRKRLESLQADKHISTLTASGTFLSNATTEYKQKSRIQGLDADSYDYDISINGATQDISLQYRTATGHIDISAPLTDFFGDKLTRHPLVLLVDKKGKRQAQKENVNLGIFQGGITFENTTEILAKLAMQQKANIKETKKTSGKDKGTENETNTKQSYLTPGYSDYVEVTISGVNYRVFISPITLITKKSQSETKTQTFYLMGFMPKSVLSTNRLTISNSLVLIVLFVLIASIAFIPLLKIRLVSINQAFSSLDRRTAFMGVGIIAGLLVIGVFDNVYYAYLKETVSQKGENIHGEISSNFAYEMESLLKESKEKRYLDKLAYNRNSENKDFLFKDIRENSDREGQERSTKNRYLSSNKASALDKDQQRYFLENLFYLSDKGVLDGKSLWSSTKFFRISDIDLTQRDYYKKATNCQVWYTPLINNAQQPDCNTGIYMERIYNVRDGRKTTQISMPTFKNLSDDLRVETLNFGTKLQTFFNPLLPKNYGFLVFENNSGTVLFHSEYEREMVENIYIETDNNQKLSHVVTSNQLVNQPKGFNANYRGEDYLFITGRLMDNVPWTLVVFYEKKMLRTMNMLTVMSAISLFLATVFTMYISLIMTAAIFFRRHTTLSASLMFLRRLFWFNEYIKNSYITNSLLLFIVAIVGTILSVVYIKELMQVSVMILVLSLCIALLLISYLMFFINNYFVAKSEQHTRKQERIKENSNNAIITHYNVYILSIVCCFFMVPAFVFLMISTGYYLDKKVIIDATYLQSTAKTITNKRSNYFALVNDELSIRNTLNWSFPCYLGESRRGKTLQASNLTKSNIIHTTQCHRDFLRGYNNDVMYSSVRGQNATSLDGLWKVGMLSFPFAKNMWFLSEPAKQGCENEQSLEEQLKLNKCSKQQYFFSKTQKVLLSTFQQDIAFILLLFIAIFIGLYFIINEWLSKRLVGTYIPQNFRLNSSNTKGNVNIFNYLMSYLELTKPPEQHWGKHVQIIRPSLNFVKRLYGEIDVDTYAEQLKNINIALPHPIAIDSLLDDTWRVEVVVAQQLKLTDKSPPETLVIKGLEMLSLNSENRLKALGILEYLMSLRQINIVLLADIAPLFRLINQAAYPNSLSKECYASSSEVLRWSRLMRNFKKVYDWTPASRVTPINPSSYKMVEHEASAWPETASLKHEFIAYHCAAKDDKLTLNSDHKKLIASINEKWKTEQVVEFFGANTGAFYRYRWELCTKAERLLLIQIASGYSPNPKNLEPLEHLIRRGYIYQSNGWYIVNKSFERFVVSAEEPHIVAQWIAEAGESTWKYFRIPIFTMIIVICAVLAYTASEAVESIMAVLTGLLGLLPLLLRNLSLFKGSSASGSE